MSMGDRNEEEGFTAEEIIGKLREAEVLLSQGNTVGEVNRKLGVTQHLLQLKMVVRGGSEQKGFMKLP